MTAPGDCRHFNGVVGPGMRDDHRCLAGVLYPTVRDTTSQGRALWPCMAGTFGSCATECAAYEPLSAVEVAARDAEIDRILDDAIAGLCPQCGRACERQQSPSVNLLICSEHGVVMRECKRIGHDWEGDDP